jgi:hypothetical protein
VITLKRSGPVSINEFVWFYRNQKSIEVIHELRDSKGNYMRTDTIRIPLRKILGSKLKDTENEK